MPSNYKRLGDYIHKVENRNRDLKVSNLVGLSMTKEFRVSTSNIVGTDMSVYKVVNKWQFSCDFMSVIRVHKFPVVLKTDDDPVLVSPAYTVFEVNDKKELNPEYLMMWFRRSEFDRYADFKCDSAIRGGFDWDALCDCMLPIPSIEKQQEIVREYNAIQNRIALNNQLICKLEETAQTIYKQWFVDFEDNKFEIRTLGDLCSLITDGKHGDSVDEINSGYYFISVKDIINGDIIYTNARQITKIDFEETHRRTDLKPGDILLTNAGTIGRMAIVKDFQETNRTTFQKSVAILKPKSDMSKTHYLYLLLKFHLNEIIELAGGSTQSNLLLGDLRNFEIKYPGFDFVTKIEEKVKPIFGMIGLKGIENRKLEELKELLLAKMTRVEN
ncbi:restriction endonuclease subunit S [Flavobacterium lacisediminis]|uniref:Restriction endonuclease subunit S n=1 Tax=Flavobacterium lacisediminis TaxID=2989705 RepID=A0ABT3EKN9_9FLAO|nr:restriction endonuclease subunit S [Flavobacterium lacisediminis]MCW1149142.1 restriction endonuclease subunit S [Flavobacterium lacisediminis]